MPGMEPREVEQRLKALQKAVAGSEPASNITAILKTLLDEVTPTEELLRVRSLFAAHIPKSACGLATAFQHCNQQQSLTRI